METYVISENVDYNYEYYLLMSPRIQPTIKNNLPIKHLTKASQNS